VTDYRIAILMTDEERRIWSDATHRANMFESGEKECRMILNETRDSEEHHIWLTEVINSVRAARRERDIAAGVISAAKERRRIIDAIKLLATRHTPDGEAVLLSEVFAAVDIAHPYGGTR